jgi:diguanylate cyclase (GGDEF)-like protein
MKKNSIIDELSFLDIFQNVSMETVQNLLEGCEFIDVPIGKRLIRAGEKNSTLYLLVEGELSIHLENAGNEQLFTLEAGDTVGEMSILDGGKTSADVTAKENSRLFVIPEEQFWCLIDVSHEFAKNLLTEFSQRLRENNSIIRTNIQLKDRYERETKIDPLTNLNNRRWLDENLPKLLNRFNRDGKPLSLIMIDIDHFKLVNDNNGHLIGDEVLALVAKEITDSLRPTDFGCRFGGEEFLAILPDSDLEGSAIAAERLRVSVEKAFNRLHKEKELPLITISSGVATSYEHISTKELIENADKALYEAKDSGRNKVVKSKSNI